MARAVSRYDEGKVVCSIREDFALVQMVYGGRYFIVWVGGRDEPYAKIDFE